MKDRLESVASNGTVHEPPNDIDRTDAALWENDMDRARRLKVETGTDTGLARRLMRKHGKDLRYVPAWTRWLVFDGFRFKEDSRDHSFTLNKALSLAAMLRQDAADTDDSKARGVLEGFARKAESGGRMREAVNVLRMFSEVQVTLDDINSNPWLLNCTNGTVDLKTGLKRPHERDDLITQLLPAEFDLNAECPIWIEFLETVQPDPAVREYLQRVAGTMLVGLAMEVPVLVFFGVGANGKSVFVEVLRGVLGDDYSVSLPSAAITAHASRPDDQERSLVPIVDKRLVTVLELGEGRSLNEPLIKALVSGETVPIRRLWAEQQQTTPRGTLILTSNHRLNVSGTDDGIWRRVREVPFPVQIPEAERDPGLRARILEREAAGVLAWMCRGFRAWQESGSLAEPAAVTEATAIYRDEQDEIGAFFAACCSESEALRCPAKRLRKAFVFWCDEQGEKPISPKRVGSRLRRRGFDSTKSHGVKMWIGFDVRPELMAEIESSGASRRG